MELFNFPGNDFIYPYSVHNKIGKDKKRFLNKAHFEKFNWLVYSKKSDGVFCKFCILFANKGGKDKNIDLKSLVTVPLTKFAKILGKDGIFSKHNQHIYHLNAVSTSNDFLICYKNPEKDINLVNSSRIKQITENCLRLKPIIETVVLCGRQNIPLRGHRDQGDLLSFKNHNNASVVNEGNFRELLRFRISAGDKILENHLQTTTSKATYISHTTQEDIISCCKDEIILNILENVKVSKYYSIIFDETTDVSHTSQMSLILRNVDSKNKVYERFISFIDCHSHVYRKTNVNVGLENIEDEPWYNILEPKLSGELLGNIVIDKLKEITLDLDNCIGIGTDGCSVMTSIMRGAVQQIQKSCKNALHSPCSNHALNLSISKLSNVQLVRNIMGIIQEVLSFFNQSSKRSFVLKNSLKGCKRSLTSLCETRWVERHDSIFEF